MSRGRPRSFETPEAMWDEFMKYEAHTRANPRKVRVYVGWEKRPEWLNKNVPLTFLGFECWLASRGICQGLKNYKRGKCPHHREFEEVLRRIRICCIADMLEGAIVGIYDARIVSRLLSL
jgi:hypothetical protein